MKTIIVPLDFSKECLTALDVALTIAHKVEANIQLVHVLTGVKNVPHGVLEQERNQATARFEELLGRYQDAGNIKLDYIVREGKIYKEVTSQAASFEDSVIILSTHGKSGFEELFIGSNAYKIVSSSSRPVISVRNCMDFEHVRKIVMPLDITFQTREKVPYTAKLAKMFGSEIHVVTLASTQVKSIEKKLHEYASQVGAFLEIHKIPFTIDHLHGGNLTDITLDYARSVRADLISIMTEQEKSISNLLLGNYAHQMLNKAEIPVLAFPTYQIGEILDDLRTQGVYLYDDISGR